MRPRTEALAGAAALLLLTALAAALGRRANRETVGDFRASTFVPGPLGSRALADGLSRLKVEVRRYRGRIRALEGDSTTTLLAVIDPDLPLSGLDREALLRWSEETGDLLLAGPGAEPVMRCFGFSLDWRGRDSLALSAPGEGGPWPRVAGVLAAAADSVVEDTTRLADARIFRCAVPPVSQVDTLLTTTSGRVAALRLRLDPSGRQVILLADAGVLRNRALRETAAGPFALALLAGGYRRVIFEEAHHGFGEGGSLAGATLGWSLRSPWGWAGWQLAAAGLVALFAGAVRFGPAIPVIVRRRRSPLEHVRALATALAAARGHDVAIGSIVQGLRRRLLPAGQRGRGDWRPWVAQLPQRVRTPRARDAARTLESLTRPGQPPDGVLRAANAVEDVWEELRP